MVPRGGRSGPPEVVRVVSRGAGTTRHARSTAQAGNAGVERSASAR